jgi:drug/metabolite transporter (DMT)-like permease
MTTQNERASAPLGLVLAAFATVYVVWGSTYLAIKFVVETIPPFTSAALRFIVAGSVLFAFTRRRAPQGITPENWWSAAVVGTLLLLGGNGLVCWAEKSVPSGAAALIVATVPLWFVLLDWALFGAARPTVLVSLGLLIGLAGVWILVQPSGAMAERIPLAGAGALLAACVSWSLGSLLTRRMRLPSAALLSTAMQMLCGGAALLVVSGITGEWTQIDLQAISLRSVLSLAYLIVFGAILAFSAYVWLLQVSTPARVATYAYVNPVIAVVAGWAFANEPLSTSVLVAAALIVLAVALITLKGKPRPTPATRESVEACPAERAC